MSSVMVPSGWDREAEAAVMAMRLGMVREPILPGEKSRSYMALFSFAGPAPADGGRRRFFSILPALGGNGKAPPPALSPAAGKNLSDFGRPSP